MVNFFKRFIVLFWWIFLAGNVACYKILAFFPYSSTSHMNVFLSLANELISRGNEITIVHPFSQFEVRKEIKMIHIPFIEETKYSMSSDLFSEEKHSSFSRLFTFSDWYALVCRQLVTSKEFQSLLEAGKQFDIVIVNVVFNECALAVASLVGSHVIVFSAGPVPSHVRLSAPRPYSAVPNYFSALPTRMNFFQRMQNVVLYLSDQFVYDYILVPKYENILHEYAPQALPIHKSWNEIALTILNSDPLIVPPRPTVPTVVTITCPHCKTAKPLPKDLQKFVDDSEEGFIIFTLGSFIQSKHLPKEVVNDFLEAFSHLKQRIIWKYEDDSLEVPTNVKITKWIPQQDLCGCPNIRLFITHGGLLGLQEAIYHGVPVLGIPLFGDQFGNLAKMQELGLGRRLYLNNISAQGVYDEISAIINDKSYYEKIKEASKIIKDQDLNGSVKGAYWIEYVARHNGAKHLRTIGEDMPFIQYFLIDVIAFVAVIISILLYALILALRKIWRQTSVPKIKID